MKCHQRVAVFKLRVLCGAEPDKRAGDSVLIAQFPLDGRTLLVDRLRGGKVSLEVQRVAEVLEHVGLQFFVTHSNREFQGSLVERLCARVVPPLRGGVRLT